MFKRKKFFAMTVLAGLLVVASAMAAFAAEPPEEHGLTCKKANGDSAEEGVDYSWEAVPSRPWNLTILSSGLVISGTSNNEVIVIGTDEDVELTLDNVTIDENSNVGIRNSNAETLTIILKGTNRLGNGPEEYTGDETECDRLSGGIISGGNLIFKDYSSSAADKLIIYAEDEGLYAMGDLKFDKVKSKYVINSLDTAIATDGELNINGGEYDLYGNILAEHIVTKFCSFTNNQGGTSRSSSHSGSSVLFTGSEGNPVKNGTWRYDEATDIWTYSTSRMFKNTWAYIANPYAGPQQHQADWFYFNEEGHMVTGWQLVYWNGVLGTYYFNEISDGTRGACF